MSPQDARGAEMRAGMRARGNDAPTASEGRALLDAAMTEKAFSQLVVDTARVNGWMVYRTFDSRRSPAGFPDLVLTRERLVVIELKTERGRVRPEQWQWIDALLAADVETWVFRPRDWGLIEQTLR